MYLALYRKYRPATFDDVISQEHITTTLKNQIKSGKTAHAYLFTGSRGTGKTTCAKLMAKAVNCLSPVDGNPCGQCEACRAIAEGCPDIVEMDAASNNGVENVRALRDEVIYAPVTCKYRVYIIDEVHMMSVSAFNALLKTIEEPPPHVIFILATTELHKVPATILSRCQQFTFGRIAVKDSAKRLCEVAEKENVKLSFAAAELISRLSDGGMRDALSLLDRCASATDDISEQTVRDAVGLASGEHLFTLADCIKRQDAPTALKLLSDLHNESKDPILLLDELSGHFRNLMLLGSMNMDFTLIPPASGDTAELKRQAAEFSVSECIRCIDILQDFTSRGAKMPRRETAAQMCLIRLCTPDMDSDTTSLSIRLERLEKKLDGLSRSYADKPSIAPAPTVTPTPKPAPAPEKPAQSTAPAPKPEPVPEDPAPRSDGKPDWLFNVEEEEPLPFEPNVPMGGEEPLPFEPNVPTGGEEPLPFEPNVPAGGEELPTGGEEYPIPEPDDPIMQLNDLDPSGQWAQIYELLPDFLKALLKDVKVQLTEREIIFSGYSPFLREFLSKGDSAMRLISAAKQITSRQLTLKFAEDDKDDDEIRDRAGAFLKKAESMGVIIKTKKN